MDVRIDRWRGSTAPVLGLVCALVLLAGGCSSDKGDDKSATTSGGSSASTAPKPTGAPVKLSVIAPAEGIAGQPEILSGAEAAVAAINASGGITDPAGGAKRPLELVECKLTASGDEESQAPQCAKDAIAAGVVADVAKYSFSQNATKAFQAAGVPDIGTIGVTAEDYLNPNVFPFEGAAVGTGGSGAALQKAGAKTIGLISADNPGGRFLPQFMTPVLQNGKADLINETYLPLDPSVDVTPFVSRVVRANPDGLSIAESTQVSIKLVTSLRQAGYQGKLAVVGLSPTAIKTLGSAAEGIIQVGAYEAPTTTTNPTIKQFVSEMDRFASDAARDEFSLNAWLSVHFVADQLAKLPKIDAASLLGALNAHPTVDLGVAPAFQIGATNSYLGLRNIPRATVQFQKVENGKVVRDGDFVDLNTLVKK
jgi:ABC-type branched-subunit amino acid transport system substrate-binding protein